jgi:hypothetical protein
LAVLDVVVAGKTPRETLDLGLAWVRLALLCFLMLLLLLLLLLRVLLRI